MKSKIKSNVGGKILEQWSTTLSEGASSAGSWFTGEDSQRESALKAEQQKLDQEAEIEKARIDAQKDVELARAISGSSSGKTSVIQRPSVSDRAVMPNGTLQKVLTGAALGGGGGAVVGSIVPGIGTLAGLFGGAITGAAAAYYAK